MDIANNRISVFAKRTIFLFLAIVIGVLFASNVAFAATSIKNGWIALDSNKKPVLEGVQYVLSGQVKPVAYITNGAVTKPVGNNSVVYLSNTKAGRAQALVIGDRIIGFKDAFLTTFTIVNTIDMSKTSVGNISDQLYTGKQIKPKATVKYGSTTLKENVHYKLSYGQNVKSTGSVTISGIGSYSGNVTKNFKIYTIDISKTSVGNISEQPYTGKQIKPKVTVKYGNTTLKENVNYTLSYGKNVNLNSTGTVTVNGIGSYSGKITKSFNIGKVPISSVAMTPSKIPPYYCDSFTKVTPGITLKWQGRKLVKNKDYKIQYTSCVKPGMAKITITGIGAYKGRRVEQYRLVNIGDRLARAACRMSYSRACQKSGTKLYKKHWGGHHDCAGGMWAVFDSYTGYYKNMWHRNNDGLKYICTYREGDNPKKLGMQPGDLMLWYGSSAMHTLMYVGTSIPNDIYKQYIKGKGVANGDLGAPVKGTMFVSSHHSYPSSYGAPLCMCKADWGAMGHTYKVYRVKSDNKKWRAGQIVK